MIGVGQVEASPTMYHFNSFKSLRVFEEVTILRSKLWSYKGCFTNGVSAEMLERETDSISLVL